MAGPVRGEPILEKNVEDVEDIVRSKFKVFHLRSEGLALLFSSRSQLRSESLDAQIRKISFRFR